MKTYIALYAEDVRHYSTVEFEAADTVDAIEKLVRLRDSKDPETGEPYTVKRYQSEKVEAVDNAWRHLRITLHPNNPAFQPIILTSEDEESVQVVAEVVEVLS